MDENLVITKYSTTSLLERKSSGFKIVTKIMDFFVKQKEKIEAVGNERGTPKSNAKKEIIYIGNDNRFRENLLVELSRFQEGKIDFNLIHVQFNKNNILSILPFLLTVSNDSIIFIDFSGVTQKMLSIVKIINFSYPLREKLIIGLLDVLSTPFVINASMSIGGQLNHVKRPELAGIIFHSLYLKDPKIVKRPRFATSEDDSVTDIYSIVQIGYVESDGVYGETNFPLEVGQEIEMDWKINKIHHKQFKVKKITDHNLYYNKEIGAKLEFIFKDSLEDRDSKLKFEVGQFIKNNQVNSVPKLFKVNIIDPNYDFLAKLSKGPDEYNFLLRFHDHLSNDDKQVISETSNLLVLRLLTRLPDHLVDTNEDEGKRKNSSDLVKGLNKNHIEEMITMAKSSPLSPYVFIYNCPARSEQLVQKYSYDKIKAFVGSIDIEKDIITHIENLNTKKNERENNKDRVYIDKNNPCSLGIIKSFIVIKELNEVFIQFNCEISLPPGSIFQLKKPISAYVTVVEDHLSIKKYQYLGLIHGLNEVHLIELRRYVYDLQGREMSEKEREERQAFFDLNREFALKNGLNFDDDDFESDYDVPQDNLPENFIKEAITVKQQNMQREILSRLYAFDKYPCNIHIKLSEQKYLKLFNEGEPVDKSRIDQLKNKGLTTIYISEEKAGDFFNMFHKNILDKTNLKILNTNNKTIGHLILFDHILNKYKSFGLSDVYLENLKQTVDSCVAYIYTTPSIRPLLEKTFEAVSYLSEHSLMLCIVTNAIVQNCGWESRPITEKMTWAALLHDVTLEKADLSEIEQLDDKRCEDLSEEDIQNIKEHPVKSAEILKDLAQHYEDLDRIVLEHHERPGGKGFPRKLDENHITPLTCVFIISEVFINEIFHGSMQQLDQITSQINEQFNGGNFTIPLEGFNQFVKNITSGS